jgi:hypothetical protein
VPDEVKYRVCHGKRLALTEENFYRDARMRSDGFKRPCRECYLKRQRELRKRFVFRRGRPVSERPEGRPHRSVTTTRQLVDIEQRRYVAVERRNAERIQAYKDRLAAHARHELAA